MAGAPRRTWAPWATRRRPFHFIPVTVETLARLPLAASYLSNPDDPQAQPIVRVFFLLYLAGVASQIARLRLETRDGRSGRMMALQGENNEHRAAHDSGPLLAIATMGLAAPALAADAKVTIEGKYATVNGVKLHYLVAGKGEPVILLHGYAQNSHMWRPLMAELGKDPARDRARPARLRRFRQARVRLRQEDDGAGHPRARPIARHQEGAAWPDTTSA